MRKIIGIILYLIWLFGCSAHPQSQPAVTPVAFSDGKQLQVLEAEKNFYYVIDPRVQSCFLVYVKYVGNGGAGTAMSPIDCQKLRAGVPEAAASITWGSEPEVTPDGG